MAAQKKSLKLDLFGKSGKKKKAINLLPREEFAASTKGRILAWLLSTFKTIVIVTEMIVMGAFLSRFWLDARSSDLNDEIRQKQAIIAASKEFEDEFKQTQTKLKIVSELSKKEKSSQEILSQVSSRLPQNIYLSSFSYSEKEVKIRGISPSELAIAQLITNLGEIEYFKEITLSQLDTSEDQSSLLIFGVTIDLQQKGGKV